MSARIDRIDERPADPVQLGSALVFADLLPITATVLAAFLVIGLALPVLPLHVRDDLDFGPFIVGLVAGSQFAASLLSRVWAGRICDRHGPKRAVTVGLVSGIAAGLLYLGSSFVVGRPALSVTILLAGRGVLGGAESFIITGATVWGLTRAGARNAGKVIAWTGTAMFLAFAAGAPLGIALYDRAGFVGVAAVTAIAPVPTLLLVAALRPATPPCRGGARIGSILRDIWLPGAGAALSSIGFGVIVSFASLLFAERGWSPVWLPFTSYAVALIVARLLFGHLPDKAGGAKVAFWCVFIEATGLILMGLGSTATLAAAGAALTGFGYALVFPGLGAEAVRRAPAASRGIAMGAYTACLDLALGVAGPVLGLVATGSGLAAAFLIAAGAVLAAAGFAAHLMRTSRTEAAGQKPMRFHGHRSN